MRTLILLTLLLFVSVRGQLVFGATFEVKEINYLSVNSAITPATLDYLKHQFSKLPENSLVVIKMNTPGGLVSTTKEIITLIGRQKFPVAVWITPEGASAASAGAIIASAAHFIFMAPGTNMGAATPVGLGEDLKENDGRKKAMNDLTAMVRSLSNSRGRPATPFEDMIKNASSYTDRESLKLKIIDGIVSNHGQLESILQGKSFTHQGVEYVLQFDKNVSSREYEPTMGQKLLEVLADPSTAYFLFLIGIALIYFEFQAPGGFLSGSLGLVFIILSAISFQVLPLDWGALGLIILGIGLLVLEVFITSYGLLTIFGLVAFVMGSLFLFHGETGFISVEYPVMFSTLAGMVFSVGIIVWYLYKEKKNLGKVSDFFLPTGAIGKVMTKSQQGYQVKVKGETWNATSPDSLDVSDQVEVVSVDQERLVVHVKKVSNL
ncbi:MAG TPA: NfeD family protein [Bacteriovoracaceae bacterium]|nr:NfeD family protein [Bacteriovoracaceae bacterium]